MRPDIMDGLGQYACLYCGESDATKLVLEHVTGSGNTHRRDLHRRGSSFYRWYAQQGYPHGVEGYTLGLACQACNLEKSLYEDRMRERNGGTHKRKQVFGSIKESNYEWLQHQRQATDRTIGELLDPMIERAQAEAEMPSSLEDTASESFSYLNVPRACSLPEPSAEPLENLDKIERSLPWVGIIGWIGSIVMLLCFWYWRWW